MLDDVIELIEYGLIAALISVVIIAQSRRSERSSASCPETSLAFCPGRPTFPCKQRKYQGSTSRDTSTSACAVV